MFKRKGVGGGGGGFWNNVKKLQDWYSEASLIRAMPKKTFFAGERPLHIQNACISTPHSKTLVFAHLPKKCVDTLKLD